MYKNIALLLGLMLGFFGFSQKSSLSPYSFYGIGQSIFSGTAEDRSMGGIAAYSDSIHANLQNPAGLSELKLVNYAFGVDYKKTTLKSDVSNSKNTLANLNYLSVVIPTKPFVFGFGIMPRTAVGYRLKSTNETTTPAWNTLLEGEGGVTQVYVSFAKKIGNFGLGFTLNHNFGSIDHTNTRYADDVQLVTQLENQSILSGLSFKWGATYKNTIKDRLQLRLNYFIEPSHNLKSNNTRFLSTQSKNGSAVGDREEIDLESMGLKETEYQLPLRQSFGIGIGEDLKWFVGAQFNMAGVGSYNSQFYKLQNTSFDKAKGWAVGGFYIPNYNSFTNYFSRIVYRVGLRNQDTGLRVMDQAINDFGITFGVGLPLGGFSNANIGVEFGKRGTVAAGLVQENYINFRLGLSLNDRWFLKRQYD